MPLAKADMILQFDKWLSAWNSYDLSGVLDFMHEDIVFENWDGTIISGKVALQKAWALWFRHRNFKFIPEDLFIDEQKQKITFAWILEWPSLERKFLGRNEVRRGMDIIDLADGKIYKKNTYSKTVFKIDSVPVRMSVH